MSGARALRRHHIERLGKKRRDVGLAISPGSVKDRSDNELAVRHPLDCGSRCLMCHWGKFMEPRRAREKREWRREWR